MKRSITCDGLFWLKKISHRNIPEDGVLSIGTEVPEPLRLSLKACISVINNLQSSSFFNLLTC